MTAGEYIGPEGGWDLFLDDVRIPREQGWAVCRSVEEAKNRILRDGPPRYASLDHDMGIAYCRACMFSDTQEPCLNDFGEARCGCTCHVELPTGLDLLKWMAETGNWPQHKPQVHSSNLPAAARIRYFIDDSGRH